MRVKLEAYDGRALLDGYPVEGRPALSWGLLQTGVASCRYTGRGVRVAILDSGLDRDHPDFRQRPMMGKSFVFNETDHDGNGHGTHCAGVVLGPEQSVSGTRYGVAPDADPYIAKVMPDAGMADTRLVLEGIEWALHNQCRIISISLGNRVRFGETHSVSFEQLGQRALEQGALIIASAGNDSWRDIGRLLPVGHPANCPSFLAVGAVDRHQRMYNRCNRALNPGGGKIDLVAPGVAIHSAWSGPEHFQNLDGTSMASSFVAGVAALWIEAFPGIDPLELKRRLIESALPLELPPEDAGAGLVQAPGRSMKPNKSKD